MKKILYILVVLTLCIGIDRISAYTEYKIGDVVPYNGMDFYVIKNSDSKDNSVTMLKAEPLTVEEVQQYGVGHVNRYTRESSGIAFNLNGYGGIAYYTSETCKNLNSDSTYDGCTIEYNKSEVKQVVDAWKTAKAPLASEARLCTVDEVSGFGYEWVKICPTCRESWKKTNEVPSWLYNSNYSYWTMTPEDDSTFSIWKVSSLGELGIDNIYLSYGSNGSAVRPVITLKKTVLGDIDESIVDDNIEKEDSRLDTKDNIVDNKSNENKTTVKVANTYMSSSIIIIILGFIIASVSVFVLYKVRNKSIK